MNLTKEGLKAAKFSTEKKRKLANDFLRGFKNVRSYVLWPVCYEYVVYLKYLFTDRISLNDLQAISGNVWRDRFRFTEGTKWVGQTNIPRGTAIGFSRIEKFGGGGIFHAAISVGGTYFRAVNGGIKALGQDWREINLRAVLNGPNERSNFTYDDNGTEVEVETWLSKEY